MLTDEQQQLVIQYIPLAHKLAGAFAQTHIGEIDDFVSTAFIGLIKAAEKYDPRHDKKASFFTYARIKINGELLDSVRSETHYRSSRAEQPLPANNLGRHRNQDIKFLSLELISSSGSSPKNEGARAEWPDKNVDVEDDVVYAEKVAKLNEAFATLDLRSQKVLYWRYVMDMPQRDIAKRLGVSQGRIVQIIKTRLAKMSEILERES